MAALPGLQTGRAPWDPGWAHLTGRLAAIGLPALTAEGTALHIHQHLDVWGVRLTSVCVGGYCAKGQTTLQAFVNGKALSGDPRRLVLASHQEIVVAFGTTAQLPRRIPASYSFPQGE